MTKKEYLERISGREEDGVRVGKIAEVYGADLPDMVKKIVSCNDEPVFFDDGARVLSWQEIMDAENDLHVEFAARGMMPLVDCGENDFIVYHFRHKIWSKFNITDETVFKKKGSLEELFR